MSSSRLSEMLDSLSQMPFVRPMLMVSALFECFIIPFEDKKAIWRSTFSL
jgi:hypothetical protein